MEDTCPELKAAYDFRKPDVELGLSISQVLSKGDASYLKTQLQALFCRLLVHPVQLSIAYKLLLTSLFTYITDSRRHYIQWQQF